MTICLFYLPHVVLREVILSMDFSDLTCLALASKMSYDMVKFYRRKSLLVEIIAFNELYEVYVSTDHSETHPEDTYVVFDIRQHEEEELVKINGAQVQIRRSSTCLSLNYEDRFVGLKSLMEFVRDLFGTVMIEAHVDQEALWILEWLDSQSHPLFGTTVRGRDSLTAEEYAHVLSNDNAQNLFMAAKYPEEFQFCGEFKERNLCIIRNAEWITADNLIAMNCTVIDLRESYLPSSAINLFLKAWVNGDVPKTKWLRVRDYLHEIDLEEALEDLEVVEKAEKRAVEERFEYNSYFTSTYEIRQEAGAKALVGYESCCFFFCMD